jgi:hypothetical protein
VARVVWSRRGRSEVEMWLNGARLFGWSGPLAYENEEEGPYLKCGLYWSPPGPAPIAAWFDNYSRGHSYAEVDPSVLHTGSDRGSA